MAVHTIPDEIGLRVDSLRVYASKSGDASVEYAPDLAAEVTLDTDDIIIVKGNTRTLYKCIIQQIRFNFNQETSSPECTGIEDTINTIPWEAVNDYYNVTDLPCLDLRNTEKTIQDFFDEEFVDPVDTWFTEVEIGSGIGALLLPELETKGKGFFDILKAILAPYPHIRWAIEYDDTEGMFPLGKLVIYDATVGRDEHTVTIGTDAVDFQLTKDIFDCAQNVHLYGYGDFLEKLEVGVPAWQKECIITRQNVGIKGPQTPDDNISIGFEDDEFFLDLHLYANDAPWFDAADQGAFGGGGIFGDARQMRLWPGGDIAYNVETGEVRFLFADDEEGSDDAKWWWVNNEDGTVYPPDHFEARPGQPVHPAFIPGIIRRPIGYRNSHLNEDIRWWAEYKTFTEEAFRMYRVSEPISDFRIRELDYQDQVSGEETKSFRVEDESLEVFRPANTISRYEDFEEEYDPVDYDSYNEVLFPGGTAAEVKPWYASGDGTIKVGAYTPVGGGFNLPTYQIPMLKPQTYSTDSLSLAFSVLVGFWKELESDVSFEEGTNCIVTSKRQLAAYPQWNDQPVKTYEEVTIGAALSGVDAGVIASTLRIDSRIVLYTWPVLVHYTAWREAKEDRTTPYGLNKHVNNHMKSAFIYRDGVFMDRSVEEPEPVTVFDNISQPGGPFIKAADMLEEYYGEINWKGTIRVHVEKGQDGWVVPYKVGDTVVLAGEVPPELTDFRGLVNGVDLSSLDNGIVSLSFGKHVPARNPFAPAEQLGVSLDIEGFGDTDPLNPAVTRVK
ncbi:MAG: hypothetical protein GF334_12370 [Candidatus Altiarchaeales archaeon]|nr:hypothetical protein [Candidatus Altiarchaeales archaeon]